VLSFIDDWIFTFAWFCNNNINGNDDKALWIDRRSNISFR
jgi:hypothetical protein